MTPSGRGGESIIGQSHRIVVNGQGQVWIKKKDARFLDQGAELTSVIPISPQTKNGKRGSSACSQRL